MSDGRPDTTRLPGVRFARTPFLIIAASAIVAAAGCEGPPPADVAVLASAARPGEMCRPNYILTREPDGLGTCARNIAANGGSWEGRLVARRGREQYCQYRWRPLRRLAPLPVGGRDRILGELALAAAPAAAVAVAAPAAVAVGVAAGAGAGAAVGVAVGAGAAVGAGVVVGGGAVVDPGQVVGDPGGGGLGALRFAALAADPTAIHYGTAILGQPAPPRTVMVRNAGNVDTGGPLTVALAGQSPEQFAVTGNGCQGGALAPGASCQLQVRYLPSAAASHLAALVLDSPATSAISVSLAGVATPPPELAASPPSAGFGTILPFGAGQNQWFTIVNKGPIASGGLTVAVVGDAAPDFVKVADTCHGAALAPGQTCTVVIRYMPGDAGGDNATLLVSSPFGTSAAIALGGHGWPGLAGREPDLKPFISASPAVEWVVDCPNLVPLAPGGQASTVPAPGWKTLQSVFHSRVGYAPATGPALRPVRVAVVDSAARPYGAVDRDRLPHGRAVGRVIADLACTDPFSIECDALVRNYLAMPLVDLLDGTEDPVNGGYYGNTGHLARALTAALDDWAMAPAGTRLVINVSLGWEPGLSNSLAEGAIVAVLQRAACLGALVVAAAGNGAGGVGEMYPAAWYGRRAECAGGFSRPLVVSASGLDGRDQPLALSRRKTTSPLRAYAEGIVTAEPAAREPRGHTEILTGTSMAAAAISGAAAALWQRHADPAVSADRILGDLWAAGDELDERPSVCAAGPACPLSRRLSLCKATAGLPGAGACPPGPLAGPANVPAMASNGLPLLTARPCTGSRCASQATADPQTVPQPGSPSCTLGRCVYDSGDGTLVVELPPEMVDVGTTTMRVRTDGGASLDVTNPDGANVPQTLPAAFQVSLASSAPGTRALTLQFGTLGPNGFKPSSQEEAALSAGQAAELATANR